MSHPFDFFQYEKGLLCAHGVALADVARAVGTPVYAYSKKAFLDSLTAITKRLAAIDHLICFAVKSNSNLAILKILSEAGAGMDIVSGGELFRAGKAGVRGSKVVFSGVGKTKDEMLQAFSFDGGKGIFSFQVESIPELEALSGLASAKGCKAHVGLRINPDINPKTHPYISTGLTKNKFGMNRDEVLFVARNLGRFPGAVLKGLSIHIGSQILSLPPIDQAFAKLSVMKREVEEITNRPLEFLDLGGGLGVSYHSEKSPSIEQYCGLIVKHFGKFKDTRILLEPGRGLSANSGVLLTQVLYRKRRIKKDFLVIDAAMNDLMRPALYGSYHEIVPVIKSRKKEKTRKTDVVGPVCESADCLASGRPLPEGLAPGDLLAILSCGAYGFSMASNYNSRPRPAEVLIVDGGFKVIRKRESYEDLVRAESD